MDRLGFATYALGLEEVIINPQANTPFIVGIFGRWGTGKTTLMRMIEARLSARPVAPIWFSAWTYGGDEAIGAAFLQNLIGQISRRLRISDQIRFSVGLLNRGLAWDRLPLKLPAVLLRLVLILVPAVLGLAASRIVGPAHTLGVALGSLGFGASLFAGWQLLKPLVRKIGTLELPGQSLYRELDFEAHVGTLARFREQFARMVDSLPSSASRVVIFIDDLDRCEPEKALQLLDVIKVFLDVPRCIFVVGVDIAVVQRALQRRYPDDAVAQREYLSKIIQLPFHLPPPNRDELRDFVLNLDVRFPDDRCGEVFLGSVAHNPREIKRLINIYGLNWYLAQAKAGAAVTPVRLAKVVVLQQAFDSLFGLLRDRPDWLGLLERAMRGGDEPPEALGDAGSETRIITASGIALPPAIAPFLHNEQLRKLLTLHPLLAMDEDDANFAGLGADEIGLYFNFAARTPLSTGAGSDPAADEAEDSSFPDFGPRYRVLSRRGSGGIGEVFLAQDTVGGRQVAIKRLHATLAQDPNWIARFRRESDMLARVGAHPNIVTFLESGTGPGGEPYFVMEDAGSTTLETALQEGRTPAPEVLMPLFEALAHIHDAGAIHGDIKPGSIALDRSGQPRFIDFGLAFDRSTESTTRTVTGDVLATLRYASPEQSLGESLDATSDLFSFGVVLYQCLTGRHPFGEEQSFVQLVERATKSEIAPPSRLKPDLAPAVDDCFARLLARDRAARYADARTAGAAFAQALSQPPALPPPHRFYSAEEIVAAAGEQVPAPASRALLIFAVPQQRSWLVAGSDDLLFLLDDPETRRAGRIRQHAIPFADVAPIRAAIGSDGVGRVDIGRGRYATRWFYSVDLFPEPAALERAIEKLLGDAEGSARRDRSQAGPAAR